MKRKRINWRQWFHRLIHRKCWNCNVPLEPASTFYGWTCPWCGHAYLEIILLKREADVRDDSWWLSPWAKR